MVRRNSGKLFQMSGPQTLNARRPKSVRVRRTMTAPVDAERRGRCCGSDMQMTTRSTTYDGHRWSMTWCMNPATLNWIRNLSLIILNSSAPLCRLCPCWLLPKLSVFFVYSIVDIEDLWTCVYCSMLPRILSVCCWRKLFVVLPALQWSMWLSILHWWVELLYTTVIS